MCYGFGIGTFFVTSGSARKMKFCPAPSPKNIENVKLTPFSTLTCIEWPKIMNKTDFWRIEYLPVLQTNKQNKLTENRP